MSCHAGLAPTQPDFPRERVGPAHSGPCAAPAFALRAAAERVVRHEATVRELARRGLLPARMPRARGVRGSPHVLPKIKNFGPALDGALGFIRAE